MASLEGVVRSRTDLSGAAIERVSALVGEWSLLADLGFSDLVLFVRTWDAAGWIAVAHVRPATSQTVLFDDPVGAFIPRSRAAMLERAYLTGAKARTGHWIAPDSPGINDPVEVIPMLHGETVIAAVARYTMIDRRRLGELERQYLQVCDELLQEVALGRFPVTRGTPPTAAAPRVGDGMLRLGPDHTVTYASPNARTCLRQLGVAEPILGVNLADELERTTRLQSPVGPAVLQVARAQRTGEAEVRVGNTVVTLRSLPLGSGGVVLVRDVSEVRRQERALLSKDATIREIHHRVKNNLQTVGALLRLQARRVPPGDARAALLDAVARVGTIALVHDSLSHSPAESVDFDEVTRRVLAMAHDAASAATGDDHDTTISITGSFGVLAAETATPLAMVLSELLLNSVQHSSAEHVEVTGDRTGSTLTLIVSDDGTGFDVDQATGLGLQIVATLVREQLGGELEVVSRPGAAAGGRRPAGTDVRVTCPVGR